MYHQKPGPGCPFAKVHTSRGAEMMLPYVQCQRHTMTMLCGCPCPSSWFPQKTPVWLHCPSCLQCAGRVLPPVRCLFVSYCAHVRRATEPGKPAKLFAEICSVFVFIALPHKMCRMPCSIRCGRILGLFCDAYCDVSSQQGGRGTDPPGISIPGQNMLLQTFLDMEPWTPPPPRTGHTRLRSRQHLQMRMGSQPFSSSIFADQ